MAEPPPGALIVAGPTASGKSALALALAERCGGVVINADSMQVYRELRVLTARPTPAEEALAPHRLYGVRPAAEAGSVAWWRAAALAEMDAARAAGRLPILCGGTGLYLAALIEGLADIPDCGEAARAEARRMLAAEGPASLHAALERVDPATAASLRPSDSQRLARAWEVWRGTGQGLAAWRAAAATARAPWRFSAILLDPPRDALRAAIATRFASMLGPRRSTRSGRCGRSGSTPRCRRCGRMACPNFPPILRGEIDACRAPTRRVELRSGATPNGRAPGSAITASPNRSACI